jgi:branched-chain amino acid transport system ATP-binding protein
LPLKTGPLGALFYTPSARREEEELRREIEERIIDFLEIDHIRKAPVASLAYGLQKRVELARRWRCGRNCCSSTSRSPA